MTLCLQDIARGWFVTMEQDCNAVQINGKFTFLYSFTRPKLDYLIFVKGIQKGDVIMHQSPFAFVVGQDTMEVNGC